jgi:hypothetical protein
MPSAIYQVLGTTLLFADTAQTEDVALTLTALGSGAGIVSALYDRGVGAKPAMYNAQLHCSLTGTNIVGAAVEIYCFPCVDGTNLDVTLNAAFATDKRNNAKPVGLLVVSQTTTNVMMWSDVVSIVLPTRYFAMAIWNATTLPLTTSTTIHGLTMTPWWFESQ